MGECRLRLGDFRSGLDVNGRKPKRGRNSGPGGLARRWWLVGDCRVLIRKVECGWWEVEGSGYNRGRCIDRQTGLPTVTKSMVVVGVCTASTACVCGSLPACKASIGKHWQ